MSAKDRAIATIRRSIALFENDPRPEAIAHVANAKEIIRCHDAGLPLPENELTSGEVKPHAR